MSFFNELNRRNVTRVAIAYGVAGWVLTEVAVSSVEQARDDDTIPSVAVLAEELRRDPRFMSALEASGAFEVWRELGPPPGCQVSGETFSCQVQ